MPLRALGLALPLAALLALWLATTAAQTPAGPLERAPAPVVATGDVGAESAVLWVQADRPGTLLVEMIAASSNGDAEGPRRFQRQLDEQTDFTVKIPVDGLTPGTRYRWRASVATLPAAPVSKLPAIKPEPTSAGRGSSDAVAIPVSAAPPAADRPEMGERLGEPATASFSTAPAADTPAPLALAWGGDLAGQNVCRDVERGFEIFDAIAAAGPDLFIGLGDMIYADGLCDAVGRYGNNQIPASFAQAHDRRGFRAHWRYSRADPGLRRLLAQTAYYAVWDDHEVVNDFGPLHDTRDEPPYRAGAHLMPLGLAALLEQNPIAEDPRTPRRLYRSVRWGQHLEVLLLDTRQYRDANAEQDSMRRPKTMLGREQLTWLLRRLEQSDATWVVVASSVPLSVPTGSAKTGRDGWADFDGAGGFEQELRTIFSHAAGHRRERLLFIAADVHFGAAFRYRPFEEQPGFVVHELISGPLNAGVFGTEDFDPDLGAERVFMHAPDDPDAIVDYAEARRWFSFGELRIDAAGELTATLRDVDGAPLYALRLSPGSTTRLAGR